MARNPVQAGRLRQFMPLHRKHPPRIAVPDTNTALGYREGVQ